MTITRLPALAVLALLLVGCESTNQLATPGFTPPAGDYKIVVMRPDVSVSLLTAGGAMETREDWSEQGRTNILAALHKQQSRHGGRLEVAETAAEAHTDPATLARLSRLHEAVGRSIKLHKYMGLELPTKKYSFDWTLGQLAVDYGRQSDYDYALFLFAQDSFSSGGRVALQAVSFLGCAVGVCVMPAGGMQVAFTSLVDLHTGQVVWYNFLMSGTGDIRTPDGAEAMVSKLLEKMEAGSAKSVR